MISDERNIFSEDETEIIDYKTSGGKNLITEYLDDLPNSERLTGYKIRSKIRNDGLEALDYLNTRQLEGKLWEIKFSKNRIMYVIKGAKQIYFLHACRKQKGKAEKFELDKARKRAKNFDLKL